MNFRCGKEMVPKKVISLPCQTVKALITTDIRPLFQNKYTKKAAPVSDADNTAGWGFCFKFLDMEVKQ